MTKKKLLNILCLVALGMVFILYFYAAFQKGIWYKNQFLYCVNENEWSGTVYTDTLTIRREKMDNKVFLYFTWGTESSKYCVFFDENAAYNESVKIYQEDTLLFTGYYNPDSNVQILFDSSNNAVSMLDIVVTVNGAEIGASNIPNDWRPSEQILFQLAMFDGPEFRGDMTRVILIFIVAFILLLDIVFSKLFFYIRHGLVVSDPEPSELYYFFQKVGRIGLCVLIGFLMLTTFFSM